MSDFIIKSKKNYDVFVKVCERNLNILRLCKLSSFPVESDKCAVLIDDSDSPHLEFVIRQTLRCLDNTWCIKIFCCHNNYDFMTDICNNINSNIQVINLGMQKMSVSIYNDLLLSVDFWNKINSEKILIFQRDTLLFRKGINDFVDFDYIGAPWIQYANKSPTNVGNGGLSIRSKSKTIELLKKIDYKKLTIKENVIDKRLDYIAEDVYFSNYLHDINANVAKYEDGYAFSTENIYNRNSIGGHRFWQSDEKWQDRVEKLVPIKNINVIGYFNYSFGYANNAKLFSHMLDKNNIKHNKFNIKCSHVKTGNVANINVNSIIHNSINIVFTVELEALKRIRRTIMKSGNNINIIYYVCEVSGQQNIYNPIFKQYNYIFTQSKYVFNILERYKHKTFIIPLLLHKKNVLSKMQLALPHNKIICLYTMDTLSDIYRKNIGGYLRVIEGINDERFFFILKISNLDKCKHLKIKIDNIKNKNFLLINTILTDFEMNYLFDKCHIYIGLQRCEGFGYTLYEATQHNKYVLSTSYSAPREFLTNYEKFIPIDYKIVKTQQFKNSYYSKYDSEWAEPNLVDCINKLKNIVVNNDEVSTNIIEEVNIKDIFNKILY